MKSVHGKFTSFADLGAAFGIKSKAKKEKVVKCPNCGGEMMRVEENVWMCPYHVLEEASLKGKDCYVMKVCGRYYLEPLCGINM